MRESSASEKLDHGVGLEYGSADFAARVGKLIASAERVTFDITGATYRLLRPYVAANDMSQLMGATVVPELRELVVAVVLAQSHALGVSLSLSDEAAHVELGPQLS